MLKKIVALAVFALCLAPSVASAGGPVREWIRDHRPGVIFPKPQIPVPTPMPSPVPTVPVPVIVPSTAPPVQHGIQPYGTVIVHDQVSDCGCPGGVCPACPSCPNGSCVPVGSYYRAPVQAVGYRPGGYPGPQFAPPQFSFAAPSCPNGRCPYQR